MSPWMFILLTVASIILADVLIALGKKCFNRIEVTWGELCERIFSRYVILLAILSIVILSAVLDSIHLLAIPGLLLTATAYCRPIVEQPKKAAHQPQEPQKTSDETITLDDFVGALETVMEASRNWKNVSLLQMAILAALIAKARKKNDDTGS